MEYVLFSPAMKLLESIMFVLAEEMLDRRVISDGSQWVLTSL